MAAAGAVVGLTPNAATVISASLSAAGLTLLFAGAHAAVPHKEFRFILPALPLALAAAAAGLPDALGPPAEQQPAVTLDHHHRGRAGLTARLGLAGTPVPAQIVPGIEDQGIEQAQGVAAAGLTRDSR